jgi:hypothetical protein
MVFDGQHLRLNPAIWEAFAGTGLRRIDREKKIGRKSDRSQNRRKTGGSKTGSIKPSWGAAMLRPYTIVPRRVARALPTSRG